jgi:calcineurin-like phosphoesterase family protein
VRKRTRSRRQVFHRRRHWRDRTIDRLRHLFLHRRRPTVYLTSDFHLDHINIIRYCRRPFKNVREMNRVLLRNFRSVIREKDVVYFLGDLSAGRKSRPSSYWLEYLPGDIHLIRGNHDRGGKKASKQEILERGGYTFILIHNPEQVTSQGDAWIIHGHKHNTDMYNYPFINGKKKTINVSVELTRYKPVSMDYLLSLDINSIKVMKTIADKPKRF